MTDAFFYSVVDRDQAKVVPYPYVYVNADGSARELHPDERTLLEAPFHPADGARPLRQEAAIRKKTVGAKLQDFLERVETPSVMPSYSRPRKRPHARL